MNFKLNAKLGSLWFILAIMAHEILCEIYLAAHVQRYTENPWVFTIRKIKIQYMKMIFRNKEKDKIMTLRKKVKFHYQGYQLKKGPNKVKDEFKVVSKNII